MRMLRKMDFVLIAVILAAAAAMLIGYFTSAFAVQNPKLEITVENQVFGRYDLSQDQEIRIGDGNICEIRDGKVRMTYADCPDQQCVHTREISSGGGSIVCLPNRVVLRIVDGTEEEEYDALAE